MSVYAESSIRSPELVFGLVAAVGTDLPKLTTGVRRALNEVGYKSTIITLSAFLHERSTVWGSEPVAKAREQYILAHQNAGNALRRAIASGDALSRAAALQIGRAHV